MRIFYDEISKNIVLGSSNRLFATGSLIASEFRGRVSVVYKDTNLRELFVRHNQILKQDGSPAGSTLADVISYLNDEFVKTPFVAPVESIQLNIDGGAANTTFQNYLLRLDFGANGATINPTGTP